LIINEDASVLVIPHKKGYLSFDSQSTLRVNKDDRIIINKTKDELNLVHPLEHDFFSACRTKLGWSLGVPAKET
jgi:NAD+ kinase